MGRRLKARLPTVNKLLQLQLHKDVQKSLKNRQLKQKLIQLILTMQPNIEL